MQLRIGSLCLETRNGLLLRFQLELEALQLVVVVSLVSLDFLDPISQVLPLTLEQFIGALQGAHFPLERGNCSLRVTEIFFGFFKSYEGLSLTVCQIGTFTL